MNIKLLLLAWSILLMCVTSALCDDSKAESDEPEDVKNYLIMKDGSIISENDFVDAKRVSAESGISFLDLRKVVEDGVYIRKTSKVTGFEKFQEFRETEVTTIKLDENSGVYRSEVKVSKMKQFSWYGILFSVSLFVFCTALFLWFFPNCFEIMFVVMVIAIISCGFLDIIFDNQIFSIGLLSVFCVFASCLAGSFLSRLYQGENSLVRTIIHISPNLIVLPVVLFLLNGPTLFCSIALFASAIVGITADQWLRMKRSREEALCAG